MDKRKISKMVQDFEKYVNIEKGVEFWFGRDLQKLLSYSKWENFIKVIDKAKMACKKSKQNIKDHFPDIRKMVNIGSGSAREIHDFKLTRYACYLIAQNGDPRKERIAFAQSYFALQTRKLELIEKRMKLKERVMAREKLSHSETELSKLIYERGVDDKGFARIRSRGDEALFGGNSTKKMKEKLNVPIKRSLADFLPTVIIAAKNLSTEMTNFNVVSKELRGESKISFEHVKNNKSIRDVLINNKITPEDLPAEEDIKELKRKITVNEKIMAKDSARKHKKISYSENKKTVSH
jgi:DNA-damage-inducible protein D